MSQCCVPYNRFLVVRYRNSIVVHDRKEKELTMPTFIGGI